MSNEGFPGFAGIRRNWWFRFLVWLSDKINPESRYLRRIGVPRSEVAVEAMTLILMHGDSMGDENAREILAFVRSKLGIKPILSRNLPYLGD